MFDAGGQSMLGPVGDFLGGDPINSPFGTWVHYAQSAYLVLVLGTMFFGGTCVGG
jgi:hypothetical protein